MPKQNFLSPDFGTNFQRKSHFLLIQCRTVGRKLPCQKPARFIHLFWQNSDMWHTYRHGTIASSRASMTISWHTSQTLFISDNKIKHHLICGSKIYNVLVHICCRLQVAPSGESTGVTAGLAESNGSLLPSLWRDSLHVTCGLTACTPGSAPGPTLVNEYGKTLPFTFSPHHQHRMQMMVCASSTADVCVFLCIHVYQPGTVVGEPTKGAMLHPSGVKEWGQATGFYKTVGWVITISVKKLTV